jgi:hypothetical protein
MMFPYKLLYLRSEDLFALLFLTDELVEPAEDFVVPLQTRGERTVSRCPIVN